jgi:hypothetical protein
LQANLFWRGTAAQHAHALQVTSRVDKDDVTWALGDNGWFRCQASAQPCPALSPPLSLLRIRPIFPVFFAPSRLSYLTLDFRALLDPQLQWRQFGLNKSQSEMNVLSRVPAVGTSFTIMPPRRLMKL